MLASDALLFVGSALAGAAVGVGSGRALPAWDALARRRVGSLDDMLDALSISEARVALGLRAWGALMVALPLVFGPLLGMYFVVIPLVTLTYQLPKWALT